MPYEICVKSRQQNILLLTVEDQLLHDSGRFCSSSLLI